MPPVNSSDKKEFLIDQISIGTEIIDRAIRWVSPLIAAVIIVVLIRAARMGSMAGSLTQIGLLILSMTAAFGHKHIKPAWRIYFYITAAAVSGIIGTLNWGLMGAGHATVLLSMVFASILGLRRFFMILCLLLAAKIAVALVWVIRKPEIPFDFAQLAYEPSAWALTIMGIAAAGCAALIWEATYRKLSTATYALQESEHRYEEIFNAAGDALIIFDETGSVVDANQAAHTLFGMAPGNVAALDMDDLSAIKGTFAKAELDRRKSEAIAGVPQVFEWQSNSTDGSAFPSEVALRGTRIRGKTRLIASVRDITERKQVEEEMSALHTQLFQAQRIETVGRLAGGVAHDFNNMLSVILGHTELALDHVHPEEELHESLIEIQKAAQRSARLTRQLLAYARKQVISPRVINLNDALSEMIALLQRLIDETVKLVWVPGDDLWPVKIDPTQLDQVLSNLCVNAKDAIMETGTITIATQNMTLDHQMCRNIPDCSPGDYVMLSVADNGCGMDPETLSNVFEPFFTTKNMAEATGLGLSTVYGIVKQNNGHIRVESSPHEGTCFRLYFPCHNENDTAAAEDGSGTSVVHINNTILMVEDEMSILSLGKLMLEKHGYRVITANSPGQAIQKAREHNGAIDLLITDVVMPEMNGRELAGHLLALYPDLKQLFMSGYTADVIAHHGVLDEGQRFLQKPFTRKDLMEKVQALLEADVEDKKEAEYRK